MAGLIEGRTHADTRRRMPLERRAEESVPLTRPELRRRGELRLYPSELTSGTQPTRRLRRGHHAMSFGLELAHECWSLDSSYALSQCSDISQNRGASGSLPYAFSLYFQSVCSQVAL